MSLGYKKTGPTLSRLTSLFDMCINISDDVGILRSISTRQEILEFSMNMNSCTACEPSNSDIYKYASNKLSYFRKSKFVYTSVFITDSPQMLPR